MNNMENQHQIGPESGQNERAVAGERVLTFLDSINAEQIFDSDEHKREFIRNTDYPTFKQLLIQINGLIRSLDIAEFDGENVAVVSPLGWNPSSPPAYKDKEPLIQEAWLAAQSMENMDDVALMLSTVICEIHPFNDGNGRLNRLLYSLFHNDYQGNSEQREYLLSILGDEGRYKLRMGIMEIPLEFETQVKQDFTGIEMENIRYARNRNQPGLLSVNNRNRPPSNPHLTQRDEKILDQIIQSDERFSVIYRYLIDSNKLDDRYIEKHLNDNGSVEFSLLQWNNIYPDLTHEDVDRIKQVFIHFKKFRIQKMIDIFVHSDNYLMPDGTTIKDSIAHRIESFKNPYENSY